MAKYIDFQITLFRWLTYTQVSRYYIVEDKKTSHMSIRKTGTIWAMIYYILWANTLIKVVYLFLTYQGWLLNVEFLDKMSILVYFLMLMEMAQETVIWCRKGLCDILVANWRLHKEVFSKLGKPEEMEQKIGSNDRFLVYIHSAIVVVGCSSLMVQYYTAPKYALNTYAVFPFENNVLKGVFAFHEFLFMWLAWVNAASSIVMCEIFSVSYTQLFRELNKIPMSLHRNHHTRTKHEGKPQESIAATTKSQPKDGYPTTLPVVLVEVTPEKEQENHCKMGCNQFKYDIEGLLLDYRKIMLATAEFNNWAGKWMGGTVATLYVQFVSDVFIMIQLLKEPGTDFMAVFFFCQDAIVGMFIMFRMLILMSRVYPASKEFLQQIKNYMEVDMSPKHRKYLIRYQRTFRPVAAKLSGHDTTPNTVPTGIHTLINYYITAMMWEIN